MENKELSEQEYVELKQKQLENTKQKLNKEFSGLSEDELVKKLAESSKNAVKFAKENKIDIITCED